MVDLIYTDEKRQDVDLVREYNLDLAYGSDENNFILTVPLKETGIKTGSYIYIEDTEYGGIVDGIGANTEKEQIPFNGRTWHGILAKKVVMPPAGQSHLLLYGDANDVIREIIELVNLDNLFTVPDKASGIEIQGYEVRYQDAYTVFTNMLLEVGAKLNIRYSKGSLFIQALPNVDYSNDEEWDSSQLSFNASVNTRPINHLICLGGGELEKRKVIHLFADSSGTVQPYLHDMSNEPTKDADYITDERNIALIGIDEVTEVYNYPNAQATENYLLVTNKPADWDNGGYRRYYEKSDDSFYELTSKEESRYVMLTGSNAPSDWSANSDNYYEKSNNTYQKVKKTTTKAYVTVPSQPSNWNTDFNKYFYIGSDNKFNQIKPVITESYEEIKANKIENWKKNFNKYYTRTWDGVRYVFNPVTSVTKYNYELQSKQPSNWKTDFDSYYTDKKGTRVKGIEKTRMKNGKQEKYVVAPAWKKKKFYTRYSKQVAPSMTAKVYWQKVTTESAPSFSAKTVYEERITNDVAPAYSANKYYALQTFTVIPEFKSNQYFELFIDNYADLVENALERMREYQNSDSISVDLLPANSYDIGDIVGATEHITGIVIKQPISKIIITINKDKTSINYEVGGV